MAISSTSHCHNWERGFSTSPCFEMSIFWVILYDVVNPFIYLNLFLSNDILCKSLEILVEELVIT